MRFMLLMGMALACTIAPSDTRAMSIAAPVYPFELAFVEATIVVRGDIVSNDEARGATLRVHEVLRGDALVGQDYLLEGSARYSFLSALPTNTTAFIRSRDGNALTLWAGPTSGGLIWSEPGLTESIVRAHTDPKSALQSRELRTKLAAAYFWTVGGAATRLGQPSRPELDTMVDSVAWGLDHGSPSTHQAAVEVIAALGFPLDRIGINYHPNYKPELKTQAAEQLRRWWAGRR